LQQLKPNKNMKKILVIIAGLALAGTAFSQVDPTRPMVTGHGNVSGCPGRIIRANQTAAISPDTVKLDKFVVTGSLMNHPAAKVIRSK
jgi:hypothetical protein